MEEIIGYVIIAVVVFVFFALNSIRYKKEREIFIRGNISRAYANRSDREYRVGEFEKIRHYFDFMKDNEFIKDYIDDNTWNDVDMDSVFKQMNNTQSSVGEEYLYCMLRKGKTSKDELIEFDELVSFFQNKMNGKYREDIERIYADIGRTKSISLFDFIHRLSDLGQRSNLKHIAMIVVILASFGLLLVEPAIGVFILIISIAVNVVDYYKTKAEIDSYFICFNYIVNLIINSKKMAKMPCEELKPYFDRINKLAGSLNEIERGVFLLPSNSVKESIGEMIMEYIRMIFHVDLIKFNSMLKQTLNKMQFVDELYEIMGRIESAYAVASYREMLNNEYGFFAKPEFVSDVGDFNIVIEEGYHPLIINPVKNSINTHSTVLLTGSNASGKSTFLKMVAINAILSQTIYTSTSKRYVSRMYSIYSSMSLRDDLATNESYYIVEIKNLKRIVDRIKKDENILCFVDEVLRGTNTVERVAASAEILKYMNTNKVMCFAATHDIELTHILEECYENYHFEDIIEDNDVKFNYRLMEGRAKSRNAIKLLGIIGFDKEIIDSASCRAEKFIASGNWI